MIGATGAGIHGMVGPLDEQRVAKRSEMIGWAIAARGQRRPDETPFNYEPPAGCTFEWNDDARDQLHDYNLLDLSI